MRFKCRLLILICFNFLLPLAHKIGGSGLEHPLEHSVENVFDLHQSRRRSHLNARAALRTLRMKVKRRYQEADAAMLDLSLHGKAFQRLDELPRDIDIWLLEFHAIPSLSARFSL